MTAGVAVQIFRQDFLEKADEILKDGDAILIKASHFMDFNKIVEALQK